MGFKGKLMAARYIEEIVELIKDFILVVMCSDFHFQVHSYIPYSNYGELLSMKAR